MKDCLKCYLCNVLYKLYIIIRFQCTHNLRHEANSQFFKRGLNVMKVGDITGHGGRSMLQSYTHFMAKDLALRLGAL